jgi:hypothetical protein
MQERGQSDSSKFESVIEHKPIDRFLINTHSFHNAHLIHAVLPRDLTIPIAYSPNRFAHHFTIATKLTGSGKILLRRKRPRLALKKIAESSEAVATGSAGKKRR